MSSSNGSNVAGKAKVNVKTLDAKVDAVALSTAEEIAELRSQLSAVTTRLSAINEQNAKAEAPRAQSRGEFKTVYLSSKNAKLYRLSTLAERAVQAYEGAKTEGEKWVEDGVFEAKVAMKFDNGGYIVNVLLESEDLFQMSQKKDNTWAVTARVPV